MKLTRASQGGRCSRNIRHPQPGEYQQHGSTPSRGPGNMGGERGRDEREARRESEG